MPGFEFTDIGPIDAETEKLVATFNGQKTPANDAKLEAHLKKWQKDAEDNNTAYEVAVKHCRDQTQGFIDKIEKHVETIRAAAKKNATFDFAIVIEMQKLRDQIKTIAGKLHTQSGELYTAMARYRQNVWRNAARNAFTAPAKMDPFDKVRKDGIDKGIPIAGLLERIDEYEERADVLLAEAADTVIVGMKDATQKEAKVRERLTDLMAQIRDRIHGLVGDSKIGDDRPAGVITSSLAARDQIDQILGQPPTALEAGFLPGRIIPQERNLKKARGKLKTLEMQVDAVKRLTKGLEKKFDAELKEIKDAVKDPTKKVDEFEKWVKNAKAKADAYLKKAPKA